jgi:hypothetical protein
MCWLVLSSVEARPDWWPSTEETAFKVRGTKDSPMPIPATATGIARQATPARTGL